MPYYPKLASVHLMTRRYSGTPIRITQSIQVDVISWCANIAVYWFYSYLCTYSRWVLQMR